MNEQWKDRIDVVKNSITHSLTVTYSKWLISKFISYIVGKHRVELHAHDFNRICRMAKHLNASRKWFEANERDEERESGREKKSKNKRKITQAQDAQQIQI